ncbi:MAG: class I SAM-dependent methyltransferase [Dermatophilaceae bacterium]|nr:class I SAM-dependent methyltransferase [Intrasporangiaceae bacterium]
MTTVEVRVSPQWLSLREPADARSRSRELVRKVMRVRADSPARMVVHDLGSGSGSMGRWLAPQLRGSQHWVLHDRDPDLLQVATAYPPPAALDGATVTVETRLGDLTRLRPGDLAGASLVTASALLDMLTPDELERFVRSCMAAACPALVTLSVTGRVRLTPSDPLDAVIRDAFNDHQRRTTGGRCLLGPASASAAVSLYRAHGARVEVRPSPWRLDSACPSLLLEWLSGWVGAACEERPELATAAVAYLARRHNDLEHGRLAVVVPHLDLLARAPRAGE